MPTGQPGSTNYKRLLAWIVPAVLALATGWVALRNGPAPAATSTTAVPPVTIIYVTMTSTPSPTFLPTATRTARPSPTRPATVTPHASRTPLPTFTPYTPPPTRTPISIPSVPAAGALLALHTPSANGLFRAITLADQSYGSLGDAINSFAGGEPGVIDALAAADLQRHYANGLPEPSPLLDEDFFMSYPWGRPGFMAYLRAAAQRYVLDHPEVLSDDYAFETTPFSGLTHRLEMDGDPGAEWFIEISSHLYSIQDWLVFDEDTVGRPQPQPVPWEPVSLSAGLDSIDFDYSLDFSGDGRPELMQVIYYYGFGMAAGELNFYNWRGGQWQAAGEAQLPPLGFTGYASDYVTGDADGDGRPEVQVSTPLKRGFSCTYTRLVTYTWDGAMLVGHTAPPPDEVLTGCQLDDAGDQRDPTARLRAFEQMVARLTDEAAPPDWLAWARVHLAMSYAGQSRPADATALLQTAAAAPGATGYLLLVQAAVAAHAAQPWFVCNALYAAGITHQTEGLHTTIDFELRGGAQSGVQPALVCPLPTLTEQLLQNAVLPATSDPMSALAAVGVPLQEAMPLNLDTDAAQEWVGVLGGADHQLITFDQAGAVWQFDLGGGYGGPVTALRVLPVNSAGEAEIFIVSTLDQVSSYWDCDAGETPLKLVQLHYWRDGWAERARTEACAAPTLLELDDPAQEAQALALLAAVPLSPGETDPGWLRLVGYTGQPTEQPYLYGYLDDIRTNMLNGIDPQHTQQAITDLLAYLPADDSEAQPARNELLYLRGLGYELASDDAAAVAAYEELIQRAPDSLWAWLAWARVGPE